MLAAKSAVFALYSMHLHRVVLGDDAIVLVFHCEKQGVPFLWQCISAILQVYPADPRPIEHCTSLGLLDPALGL
jgi:hypothetical protein